MANIMATMRGDLWRKALDLHLEGVNTEGIEVLAQSLPPNLQDLKLRLRNSSITDEDLQALAEGLPKQLKSVSLDLTNCSNITDKGQDTFTTIVETAFEGSDPKVNIDLTLADTEALQYIMEC